MNLCWHLVDPVKLKGAMKRTRRFTRITYKLTKFTNFIKISIHYFIYFDGL